MFKRILCIIMLVSLVSGMFSYAAGAEEKKQTAKQYIKWTDLNGKESETLNSVAYGNGRFVAVGSAGTIRISGDGTRWSDIKWAGFTNFKSIVYNGKCFVAVGDTAIARSVDGIKWDKVLMLDLETKGIYEAAGFLTVIWNGTSFVAGGEGVLYSSKDGLKWKQDYDIKGGNVSGTFTGTCIRSLAFSAGATVAIGSEGWGNMILTSRDALSWTKSNRSDIDNNFSLIYYTGKYFIIYDQRTVVYSEDGLKWFMKQKSPKVVVQWVRNIDGKLYGCDGLKLYTSSDGFTWQDTGLAGVKTGLRDLASDGKGTIVAVGDNGEVYLFGRDSKWIKIATGALYNINGSATDGKVLVTVGDMGQIRVTKDGSKWEKIPGVTEKTLYGVVYLHNRFIATEKDGEILVSQDGYKWNSAGGDLKYTVSDIAYGAGRYVAVGESCSIAVSTDGKKWTLVNEDKSEYQVDPITAVVFNGKHFIAVSDRYTFRSSDGLKWERIDTLSTPEYRGSVRAMLWDGRSVLAFSDYKGIIRFADDMKWSVINGEHSMDSGFFTYENGIYFCTTYRDIIISSDAVKWVSSGELPNPGEICTITGFKGKIYAFGEKGTSLSGTVQRRPEPSDTKFFWYDSTDVTPLAGKSVKPETKNNLLYMPLDTISRIIEGSLSTNKKRESVLSKNGTGIAFKNGSSTAYINGRQIRLPGKCYLKSGKIMIPAAFVFSKYEIKMDYDMYANRVNFNYFPDNNAVKVNWTTCKLEGQGNIVWGMNRNRNVYAAVVENHKSSYIAVSKDGINWTNKLDMGKGVQAGVYAIGSRLVVAGKRYVNDDTGNNTTEKPVCYYSEDGEQWKENTAGLNAALEIYGACNGKTILAMSKGSYVYKTNDGINWQKTSRLDSTYYMKWTGTEFVASGGRNIYRSKDGVKWLTEKNPGFLGNPENGGVAYADTNGKTSYAARAESVYAKQGNGRWEITLNMPSTFSEILGKAGRNTFVTMTKTSASSKEKSFLLYKTVDGLKWDRITAPWLGNAYFLYDDGKRVFIGGYGGLVTGEIK